MHKLRSLHLFAGVGGGILGDLLLGHHPICAVEINRYRQQVLSRRQTEGHLPWFPIYDDVVTFDGRPWRGLADIVAGGFPCQDISTAGKGAGISGTRSGLWSHMARIIGEVRPGIAWMENSPALTLRGLDRVLGDLAEMGYDARWGVVSAADAIWLGGTPCLDHLRERIWIIAHANTHLSGLEGWDSGSLQEHTGEWVAREADSQVADAEGISSGAGFCKIGTLKNGNQSPNGDCLGKSNWWKSEPGVDRVVHGLPDRSQRISAIGDSQVPAVVALAWRILNGEF